MCRFRSLCSLDLAGFSDRLLEDGSYAGTIRECPGVIAFGADLSSCQDELRSALEDWVLVGLKLGHTIPAIAGIDLNRAPSHAPVDAL